MGGTLKLNSNTSETWNDELNTHQNQQTTLIRNTLTPSITFGGNMDSRYWAGIRDPKIGLFHHAQWEDGMLCQTN